jgi:hypothetical protein
MEDSYEEEQMKLTPPKQVTFVIAVLIALLGIVAALIKIPAISSINIWIVAIAFLLLAMANVTKGL